MSTNLRRVAAGVVTLALSFAVATTAQALSIGVWLSGQPDSNPIDNFIDSIYGAGTAQVVSTAQLGNAALVNSFDAIVLSRTDAAFPGPSLDAAAAANVSAFGTGGNNVAFAGDWADMLTAAALEVQDTDVETLFQNAIAFAVANHGVVGELNGAAMMFASNADGLLPLNLFPGAAGAIGQFSDALELTSLTAAGAAHSIPVGVAFPFNPAQGFVFRTQLSGVPSALVLARYADGAPAIVAAVIPEPGAVTLFGVSALLLGLACRRPKRA